MNPNFCRHLRTKKMYIGALAEEVLSDEADEQAATCNFWCNLTQAVTGPDDRPAHKAACKPTRPCFEE